MLGAIFGDIVGSAYEFHNTHDYNFRLLGKYSRPTDDSYMTLAVAKALMETFGQDDSTVRAAMVRNMQEIGGRYPYAGYGGMFSKWLRDKDPQPYNSYGNGSAMRVAAAGWMYRTLEDTLHAAKLTAEVTHDHPEGIKGAQAIAAAIFLARAGSTKEQILNYVANEFQYNLFRKLDEIRPDYKFYEICQKSCPEAIIAFLEGESFEDVIRKAVSLGGDSDTIACMAGAIAEAYYGMPDKYKEEALSRLDKPMRNIVYQFRKFCREHNREPFVEVEEAKPVPYEEPLMRYNYLLEERIEACYKDPDDKRSLHETFETILDVMRCDAQIIIPVNTPDNAEKVFDPRTIKPGDTVTLDEELHFTLIYFTKEDGAVSMPVFTSREKLEKDGPAGCSTIVCCLDEYMKNVLEMENVEGLLINPGEHHFFLAKDVIKALLEEYNERKTKVIYQSEDK